jgi:hypothetical protein
VQRRRGRHSHGTPLRAAKRTKLLSTVSTHASERPRSGRNSTTYGTPPRSLRCLVASLRPLADTFADTPPSKLDAPDTLTPLTWRCTSARPTAAARSPPPHAMSLSMSTASTSGSSRRNSATSPALRLRMWACPPCCAWPTRPLASSVGEYHGDGRTS